MGAAVRIWGVTWMAIGSIRWSSGWEWRDLVSWISIIILAIIRS